MTTLIPTTPHAHRITGGAGTGKTQNLATHVASLLKTKMDATDIVVFTATPGAGQAFAARLQMLTGNVTSSVSIMTPRRFALDVLSSDEARTFTGRDARLMMPFEMNVLMEDMKVSGMRPRRLREMLRFFYRGWTELADDNPNWLISDEERTAHRLLKDNLAFTRGILESELANLAVHYLRTDEHARVSLSKAQVIVDDYHLLSRASQVLASMIATESIWVAGDPCACIEAYEPYPYSAGLEEFYEANPSAELEVMTVCHRSITTTIAANALRADACMAATPLTPGNDVPKGSFDTVPCSTPTDEFDAVARLIDDAIDHGMDAGDIYVVSPHRIWSRNIASALAARGIASEIATDAHIVSGDVRDNARCVSARILTALALAANPQDMVAWRCQCGFDDYLTNSAVVNSLRLFSETNKINLVETLRRLAQGEGEDILGRAKVIEAYRGALSLMDRVQGLHGNELLATLTQAIISDDILDKVPDTKEYVDPAIAMLCAPFADGSLAGGDAATLYARAIQRLIEPTFEQTQGWVHIAPAQRIVGLSPKLLIVCGFVNGFIPNRDYFDRTVTPLDKQQHIHAADTRLVYNVIGKAEESIACTYFTTVDLERAERLKLEVDRIRLQDGIRIALISPSDFLNIIAPKQ